MRRRQERQLMAYRDGELSPRARQRVERRLASDPGSAGQLRQLESLRALVREAWTEGPPAPAPEFVVNALRPQMARIDAERRAAGGFWRRLGRRLQPLLRPAPVTALAGTAVAALYLVLVAPPALESGPARPLPIRVTLASPTAIYDLEQEDTPLLVYESEDGVTVIWLLEDERGIRRRHSDVHSDVHSDREGWA